MSDSIVFEVINNGRTLSHKKIADIKRTLKSDSAAPSKHIGLFNLQKRINLMYGEKYGIELQSGTSRTCVSITIPKQIHKT